MPGERRRAFPLVPKRQLTGVSYGAQRSRRRGQGAEISGSRPYVPGDRLAWIDWYASARLSLVKDDDEFVVRQYYDEVAPRVIILVDRRPSMGLYSPEFPWLSKPRVLREACTAIIAAAHAARGYVGYLDFAGTANGESAAVAHWIAPHRQTARQIVLRLDGAFSAPADSFELALDYLLTQRRDVPRGSFIFILSDYLSPLPNSVWSRARARRWDVIPVIIQDPVWEQTFPQIDRLLVEIVDPQTGKAGAVRLSAAEAAQRARANEERLGELVRSFRRLDFDPILLDTTNQRQIDLTFIAWATRRRLIRSVNAR